MEELLARKILDLSEYELISILEKLKFEDSEAFDKLREIIEDHL